MHYVADANPLPFIASGGYLRQSRGIASGTPERAHPLRHRDALSQHRQDSFMQNDNSKPIASIAVHPIHPMLVPFPIACFVGALVTDLVYWWTDAVQWETFSVWLLTAGMVMAGVAVLAGLIDFISNKHVRALRPAWFHVLGNVVALILALINAFVHSRDGYTAVIPTGLILSTLVVLILIFNAWTGWSMIYRQGVGVSV
jgi:uncharacterized membrane protein